MSSYNPLNEQSLPQAVDLTDTAMGTAMEMVTAGVQPANGAGKQVVGYLQGPPNGPDVGEHVWLQTGGTIRNAIADAAIAVGQAVAPTGNAGRVGPMPATAAGAAVRCGIALSKADNAGETIQLRIV